MNLTLVIRRLAVWGLVLWAVVITVLRFTLPLLSDYQVSIQQRVSAAVGQPVEFEKLSARMAGFRPELTLDQVSILSAEGGQAILQLDQLMLRVSLLSSLLQWQLSPTVVRITGAEFSVARDGDRVAVVGMRGRDQPTPEDADELLQWLLNQRRLELADARLHYADPGRNLALNLSAPVLHLLSRRRGLEVSGRLSFVGTGDADGAGNLELVGLLEGNQLEEMAHRPWNIYINISELTRNSPVGGDVFIGGTFGLQGWVKGHGLGIDHVDGDLIWEQPVLATANAEPLVDGQLLRAGFAWSVTQGGWRGRLRSLQFDSADNDWHGEVLSASYNDTVLRVDGGGIDLAVGSRLLTGFLADQDRYRLLAEALAPAGRIDHFKMDIGRNPPGNWALQTLQADLTDIDVRSYKQFPAVGGLSGSLVWSPEQGQVVIDSTNLAIWFPEIFRQTLEFDQLRGDLDWRVTSSGWLVRMGNLDAGNGDLELRARGEVELVDGKSPRLALAGELVDLDIAKVSGYLPVGVMPPATVRWLDDALVSGRLAQAGVVWSGPLNQFPYDQGGGRFEVSGMVTGAELDYVPGKSFPPITQLDAGLSFVGTRMEIIGHSGQIFDSEISEVSVAIEDLRRKDNHLTVVGKVDGPLANGLRYLHESPLEEKVGRHLQDLSASGDSHLELALDIPLKPGHRVKVKGDLHLPGNHLNFANSRIDLANVTGQFGFDDLGVDARQLSANIFGGPATISVTSSEKGGVGLSGTGKMKTQEIAEYLGWQDLSLVEGQSAWKSLVTIDDKGVKLTVDADLADVKINLPAPIGKAREAPGQLKVDLACECSQTQAPLNISLVLNDSWFADVELDRRDQKLSVTRGSVSAGARRAPPASGVLLSGNLPPVEFAPWQQWIAALPVGSGAAVIDQVDVEVERLDIFGQKIPDLHLQGGLTAGQWRLAVASTQVEGNLVYDRKPANLLVDLSKLSLLSGGPPAQVVSRSGFGKLPLLDVRIENFLVNGRPLGEVKLNAALRGDTLVFDTIEIDAGHSRVSATGRWQSARDRKGGWVDRSWVEGELDTTDFGDAMTLVGYSRSVAGGEGHASWRLNWPDSPQRFSAAELNGELVLDVEGGSLLGIEPGLGRLFGVLSLSTLQRRMSFDFRDLVGTGFVFDDLEASVTSTRGQAEIGHLDLKGPAADITVSGHIDLTKRQLDLQAGVVPRVTQSLPLAAAIGSLGLGAAIYIGQKLLVNRIDNATSQNYHITGSIDEPEVEAIGESRMKKLLGAVRPGPVE